MGRLCGDAGPESTSEWKETFKFATSQGLGLRPDEPTWSGTDPAQHDLLELSGHARHHRPCLGGDIE